MGYLIFFCVFVYFNDYPEAVEVVKRLQDIVKQERPEQSSLRGHNWFL